MIQSSGFSEAFRSILSLYLKTSSRVRNFELLLTISCSENYSNFSIFQKVSTVFKENKVCYVFTSAPFTDNTRKCLRCCRLFNRLHSSSSSFFPTRCQYHPQRTELRNGFSVFPCCGSLAGSSRGCVTRGFHVHKQPSESVLTQFVATPKPVSASDYRSKKVRRVVEDSEVISELFRSSPSTSK